MMNYIVKNNITPLCFLPSGDLICYQYGKLIIIRDEKIITKYEIIRSKKERYIGRINLFFVFLDWAFVLQKQLMINGSY